ncbi:MAG: alanine racemase [Candidatus Cloacimonetes bacterium]|nr:alanine racemase [Candidatus Cloacimonadota bacterium]
MSELIIKSDKIIENLEKLNTYLYKHNMEWSLIVKVISGHNELLGKILSNPIIKEVHSIGDSRLSNLRIIKRIAPDIITMYIKPTAIKNVKSVIRYADISFNTSLMAILALNDEARRKNKIHRIIIMIELGELREGILRENIIEFYSSIFNLSNIEVIGLGTNLGCMYGIEPTYDKLIQLVLYKQLLETKFNRELKIITGGSSISLPLISKHKIPTSVNHFRIGEAAFMGTSPFNAKRFRKLSTSAFEFKANIIELEEKEREPDGLIGEGSVGHIDSATIEGKGRKSFRAIVDFGILDVDPKELTPKDSNIGFIGTTSDMTVYDIGPNLTKSQKLKYKVGKQISFTPSYMAVARLMNSKFIEKHVC